MKISIEWLKEYVEVRESPEKLKEDLSMIGLGETTTETQGPCPRSRGDVEPAIISTTRDCAWRPVPSPCDIRRSRNLSVSRKIPIRR
jgi:hypothetical protein